MTMNWKGFGTKRSLPNFKVLSRNAPGGTEESNEIPLIRIAGRRGRVFIPGAPEYEGRVLTTWPRRSFHTMQSSSGGYRGTNRLQQPPGLWSERTGISSWGCSLQRKAIWRNLESYQLHVVLCIADITPSWRQFSVSATCKHSADTDLENRQLLPLLVPYLQNVKIYTTSKKVHLATFC
jgi:hypothetical protein